MTFIIVFIPKTMVGWIGLQTVPLQGQKTMTTALKLWKSKSYPREKQLLETRAERLLRSLHLYWDPTGPLNRVISRQHPA